MTFKEFIIFLALLYAADLALPIFPVNSRTPGKEITAASNPKANIYFLLIFKLKKNIFTNLTYIFSVG